MAHLELEIIARASASACSITVQQMQSKSRKRELVEARQIFFKLARALTNKSLKKIGECMSNKDHATVIYGIRAIDELLLVDSDIKRKYTNALKIIKTEEQRWDSSGKLILSSTNGLGFMDLSDIIKVVQKPGQVVNIEPIKGNGYEINIKNEGQNKYPSVILEIELVAAMTMDLSLSGTNDNAATQLRIVALPELHNYTNQPIESYLG